MDKASNPLTAELPRRIRRALAGLRWRIRAYVWTEGLAVAVIWLCLTFWAGLAIDYLPVRLGADEMPRAARAIVLTVIAIVLAWILYRWILRRAFVRMADRSMAILLERRYQEFHDGLITSVELAGRADRVADHDEVMLAETEEDALQNLREVRLSSVFDARPLVLSLVGAIILVGTIGGAFAAERRLNSNMLELGFRRLYMLENDPWPRNSFIEVVGVHVQREDNAVPGGVSSALVEFNARSLKVARGSSIRLSVRADAGAKMVPKTCSLYYRTAEGDRGRVDMTRVGGIRDGYQHYRYDGKPLKGILSDVTFDVVGSDHRLRDYTIKVVDSPAIVAAELDCEFPAYMVDTALASWLPRKIPLTTATQLPQGTHFTLRAKASKALTQVVLRNPDSGETIHATPKADEFEFEVPALSENLALEVTLRDVDNVFSERPYRIYIVGIEDQAPAVKVRLQGIGSAITPDAVVPFRGQVEDDFGVAETWFQVSANDGDARKLVFKLGQKGVVESEIDFREQRGADDGIKLQPGDKLSLTVKALDKFDLGDGPNEGAGDHYQLAVVTPDELLSMLEAREFGLRRRFEQVINEMTETRDTLVRVKNEGPESPAEGSEPDDETAAESAAASGEISESDVVAELKRTWSLRSLRSQRSKLQSEKSAQESLGVAASFSDIRAELVNNRVDTEDRKKRIQEQVVDPLQHIGETMFPEFDRRLDDLSSHLETLVKERGAPAEEDDEIVAKADTALAQASEILLAMDDVLQNMLDIEDFNDLLDRVRNLIAEQEGLLDETKRVQKQQVLNLLE
jgi:hypothetical protein